GAPSNTIRMFDSPREKPELARAGQNRAEPGSVDVCFGGSPEASFLGALPYRKVVEERSADSRQSAAGPAEPPVAHRLSANRALLRALSFAPTSLQIKRMLPYAESSTAQCLLRPVRRRHCRHQRVGLWRHRDVP